jgi:dihydrodipicolinate synthase/N-acetylneuraminate lyase
VVSCLAQKYQGHEWWKSAKALFSTTSPVPVKALMHANGMLKSAMVRPPLSETDLAGLQNLETADRMVEAWYGAHRHKSPTKAFG